MKIINQTIIKPYLFTGFQLFERINAYFSSFIIEPFQGSVM